MPQVSVPEKTLEHWISQYVMFRYHSKCSLWWPAAGQDLDFSALPTRPGKAVQLEVKTTVASGANHEVKIDLGQLWDYCARPLGRQPFYVFPRPDWTGTLQSDAVFRGLPVSELAFARSGRFWWFADWMIVMTTAQVAETLRTPLAVHGSSKRGKTKPLVKFSVVGRDTAGIWADGTNGSDPKFTVRWLDFWRRLEMCGESDWPQTIRLPREYVSGCRDAISEGITEEQARVALANSDEVLRADRIDSPSARQDKYVSLTPDGEGAFRVDPSGPENYQAALNAEDRRQVVFLDVAALKPRVIKDR